MPKRAIRRGIPVYLNYKSLDIVFIPSCRHRPCFNPKDVDWYGRSFIMRDSKPCEFVENLINHRKLKNGRRLKLCEKKTWLGKSATGASGS